MTHHDSGYDVTFGDCDPAGIVFYPNVYKWLDRSFHDFLRQFGGHSEICRTLDAIGLGVMETQGRFLFPMRDGDHLRIRMTTADWAQKSVLLSYQIMVKDTLAFTGTERRALFVRTATGIKAGEIDALKTVLERHGKRQ